MMRKASPDVVIVCTPPETHVAIGTAVMQQGAHLICEKPIAPSVEEAEKLLAAAKAAGRRIAMNHEFREMPAFRAVRDAISADGSGLVFTQAWQLMNLPPWAEPGWRGQLMKGVLYEAGIHPKTWCRSLSREEGLRLHKAIVDVMREAAAEVARRGEPIEVKVRDFLKVRLKEECPRCGSKIRRAGVRGMDAYFCPRCQPATRSGLVDWTKTGR